MPIIPASNNNSIIQILQLAEKARRGGGGGKGPGSRGGKFYRDAKGNIVYGAPPKGGHAGSSTPSTGTRAVATGRGGGSGKPRVGELRPGYRIKPTTAAGKRTQQRKMLSEMDRAIKTGKDPHGNALSKANLDKLSFLATSLRTDLKGTSRKETTDGVHTGVMVAFYIDTFSPDAAVKLQIPGGETWDALHLTLAFLGDSTEMLPGTEEALYRALSGFCADRGPLEGMISGVGLFNNTEEGETNAFYASFDSPGLPSFRAQLIEMLQVNGIEPMQNHGFTPHITLAYIPKGLPIPNVEMPQMPIIFSKVTVKWGDRRTDFSLGRVNKEVSSQITEKAADRLPFTVFKDKQGKWRWIGISSSAAQDADGETVSLKALQEDTALKDTAGGHGPLNWWHSHIKLGTCDFNAMDGPLLVESGTFVNDTVAVAVEKAIREGVLQPGMSLEFEHNEPGPPVLPGRVFTKINKIGRALLPAEKASNLLTSFKVYSLKNAALADEKGSKKMLTEEKQKKALEFLTPELLEALASDNQVAVKMAESLNLSFKAVADALAPAPAGPVETVTLPATAQTAAATVELPFKVEPPVVAQVAAPVVEPPAAVVEELEGEGEALDTDALFENLANSVAGKVFAMQQAVQATATKEVNDVMAANTIAMKEVTTALNTVVAENKSLKARLDALDGIQPAVVRARASQSGGVPLEGLPADMQLIVNSEKENKDPYADIARQLGLIPASRG